MASCTLQELRKLTVINVVDNESDNISSLCQYCAPDIANPVMLYADDVKRNVLKGVVLTSTLMKCAMQPATVYPCCWSQNSTLMRKGQFRRSTCSLMLGQTIMSGSTMLPNCSLTYQRLARLFCHISTIQIIQVATSPQFQILPISDFFKTRTLANR